MRGGPSGAAPHLSQKRDLGREGRMRLSDRSSRGRASLPPASPAARSHRLTGLRCCPVPQNGLFHYLWPLGSTRPWGTGLRAPPASLSVGAGPRPAHHNHQHEARLLQHPTGAQLIAPLQLPAPFTASEKLDTSSSSPTAAPGAVPGMALPLSAREDHAYESASVCRRSLRG